jgi:hypothetical protein
MDEQVDERNMTRLAVAAETPADEVITRRRELACFAAMRCDTCSSVRGARSVRPTSNPSDVYSADQGCGTITLACCNTEVSSFTPDTR